MGERREHICLVAPPSNNALLLDKTSDNATYGCGDHYHSCSTLYYKHSHTSISMYMYVQYTCTGSHNAALFYLCSANNQVM